MMSSNLTSKIVVGLGLAAAFGIGVSIFAVHAKQESQLALSAPTPAIADPTGQNATDATAPAQSAATHTPTDLTATPSSALPAAPAVATPTSPITTDAAKGDASTSGSDEFKPAKSKRANQADRQVAKTRNTDDASATHVASAANPGIMTSEKALAPASPSNDTMPAATVGTTADTQQAPAQTVQEGATSAGPAATGNEPAPSDSQITASVKSEIATAAPNSKVDVTTTNGVVALAGSVPSQDAVTLASQAAQRVAGVKYVDASALMLSNQ